MKLSDVLKDGELRAVIDRARRHKLAIRTSDTFADSPYYGSPDGRVWNVEYENDDNEILARLAIRLLDGTRPRKDFSSDARFFVWAWDATDVLCFDAGETETTDIDGNKWTLAKVLDRDWIGNEWCELFQSRPLDGAGDDGEDVTEDWLRSEFQHTEGSDVSRESKRGRLTVGTSGTERQVYCLWLCGDLIWVQGHEGYYELTRGDVRKLASVLGIDLNEP